MDENISRAAGASHGQEMTPEASPGWSPPWADLAERTTLYAPVQGLPAPALTTLLRLAAYAPRSRCVRRQIVGPRYRRLTDGTMDRELVRALLDEAGTTRNQDVLADVFSAYDLAGGDADRLDLKITRDALREMRAAYRLFAPYGTCARSPCSAPPAPASDPLYTQARNLAAELAGTGWMVVTGAGPGIMAAATEGAGAERSLG